MGLVQLIKFMFSDGWTKYPHYVEFFKGEQKNMQEARHVHLPGQPISTLAWELSMR